MFGCVTFSIRLVTVECVSLECGISKCKQREEGEWQFSGQFALKGKREGSSIKGSNIYYRRGDGGVHQDFLRSTFLPEAKLHHLQKIDHLMMG